MRAGARDVQVGARRVDICDGTETRE